ncbi:MAG: DUF4238 domain-containing protein [Candidatus Berkiella sp.]
MALDHYISQVHLKNFYSKTQIPPLNAICKITMNKFPCSAKDVCRIEEGNTNYYLEEPRVIETFVKDIENRYNWAVAQLSDGLTTKQVIYVIAGWIAYVQCCSPAGSRIYASSLKNVVHETARTLEKKGDIPPPPEHLKLGGNLTDLIDSGRVELTIDPKYPQSVGIQNVLNLTYMYGNFKWDIIKNAYKDSPFFTSDYPLAIELQPNSTISNIIVPLNPGLALRINTTTEMHEDENFTFNRIKVTQPDRKNINRINMLIAQCAEEHVFFGDESSWMFDFVKKHCKYHVGTKTAKSRHPNGSFMGFFKTICLRDASEEVSINYSPESIR